MESKQFMNNNEIYNAFYGKFNIANWFSYNAFIELAEYNRRASIVPTWTVGDIFIYVNEQE